MLIKAIPLRFTLPAFVIEIFLIGIRLLGNLQSHITELVTLLLLTYSVYLVPVQAVTVQTSSSAPPSSRPLLWWILSTAILFRVTVFPLYPTLSDDLYRYRWEGKLQQAGGNPYQVRPKDEAWKPIRDETFANVGLKDFKGIYGPLLLLEERLVYKIFSRIPDAYAQVFWFKSVAALADLGIIGTLLALLKTLGRPLQEVLIYAWSPLPVVEFWISGHNDAIVVLCLVLALLLVVRNHWPGVYTALGIAVAAKIWPLILYPAFLWRSRERGRWAWALLVVPIVAVAAIPFWSHVTENAQFASGFVGGWRNNDSLFGLLLWLSDEDLYRAKYLGSALICCLTIVFATRRWPLERVLLATIVTVLFVSANCHPWYLTWFLPLLTLWPFPPILLWTALMPVSYAVLIPWKTLGEWNGSTPLRWLIFIPVYGALVLYLGLGLARNARNRKQSRIVLR